MEPSDELERLRAVSDAQRRGYEFQDFIAMLFRREHFRVEVNPGTARPRQTHLLATRGGEVFLIEAKWRADKANIDDHGQITKITTAGGHVLVELPHRNIVYLLGNLIDLPGHPIKLLPELLQARLLAHAGTDDRLRDLASDIRPAATRHWLTRNELSDNRLGRNRGQRDGKLNGHIPALYPTPIS